MRQFVSVFAMLVLVCATAAGAVAAASGSDIVGTLVSQEEELPIAGAAVTLYRNNTSIATTSSDPSGQYRFPNVDPGEYSVVVKAAGYQLTRIAGITVVPGAPSVVRSALLLAVTSTTQLHEIAAVRTRIGGNTLASSSTIQHDLNPDQLQAQGYLNASQALATVPGINLSGGQHTAGDDVSIDVRGFGAGEVRPLIDGHPIGPIGVGSTEYYDYANSPYFLLQNIQTTAGSGATGLYGVDVIGGTIDFQTLEPSRVPHTELYEGLGNQGLGITETKTTGSYGHLGYALGHTVQGAYNNFQPGPVFQGARPNNNLNLVNGGACLPGGPGNPNSYPDISTCNTNLNTYGVSANYRVQNDVGKLRYNFTPSTALTVAAYAGNQLSDSTGNGDNDFLPYDTRLAEILTSSPQCGANGYFAVTNTSKAACLSAQTLAGQSYGPDGGGEDRNRGTTLQDYNARFTTVVAGHNSFTADVFRDFYQFRKNSNAAAGLGPNGLGFIGGGTYSDDYLTNGVFLSDDIAGQSNDFGFGYFIEHQRRYGSNFSPASAAAPSRFVPQPELGEGDYSFFIRDEFTPNRFLTAFVNAWSRRSGVTQKTTFDPRLSLIFKPTTRDIVRLTGGRADGDPSIAIKSSSGLSNFGNPSSLNPSCALPNPVAQGSNPNLLAESATDYEAAVGHRFWSDTSVNLVGYVSSERNELFGGIEPITAFGPTAYNNPLLVPLLGQYAQKIQAACPALGALDATTVLKYLGISTTFNAASALYRGVELSGRVRVSPIFYTDFSYDVQSSQQTGIPVAILVTNPFLINGAQIYDIPVHKGSLTLDYNDQHGVEAQLEGHYIGINNDLNRPGFTFFNAFVSKALGKTFTATLGAENLFDQNAQNYGYFGHGVVAPLNQYAPKPSPAIAGFPASIQQTATLGNGSGLELLGIAPALFTFSVSAKI